MILLNGLSGVDISESMALSDVGVRINYMSTLDLRLTFEPTENI